MLTTAEGSNDGLTAQTYREGAVYDVSDSLGDCFLRHKQAEPAPADAPVANAAPAAPPVAPHREKKPSGAPKKGAPETKVVAPAEQKADVGNRQGGQ